MEEEEEEEEELDSIHPAQPTAEDAPALEARRAVAYAIRHIRRWDEAGVLAAWDTAARRGHDFAAVAVCLIESAADPSAKTPGIILSRLANGWRAEQQTPTPLPKLDQCPTCHLRHAPDAPCGAPGGTEPTPEYLAAREAL